MHFHRAYVTAGICYIFILEERKVYKKKYNAICTILGRRFFIEHHFYYVFISFEKYREIDLIIKLL